LHGTIGNWLRAARTSLAKGWPRPLWENGSASVNVPEDIAMDIPTSLLSISAALTLGAISPGPSFVMVARTALAESRRNGLAAAVGMGIGGVLFSVAAVAGLLALLAAVPMLYLALKLIGGAYLVHLGYRIWRDAKQPLAIEGLAQASHAARWQRAFLLGFITQISNPKTAVVYASIFASLLPPDAPSSVLIALPVIVFLIETVWYSIVAIALSSAAPRARYLASKTWLDRAAGGIMILLGIKLLTDAVHS
jgi:threonine/homoserine/homoserine lactone efflux protein